MNKSAIRRELFPVTRQLVYLNHAAVGPLSERACRAMETQARDHRDHGALHWREWVEEYVHFRNAAARMIGASPDEISILKNTSEGVSFVAEGFRWNDGDNVITTDMEFPSNFVPWKRLERRGVECRQIANRNGAFAVEDVERLIDSRTRLVALSSVYFHNGFACDLALIGELCAARGIELFVDAIQSIGAVPIDVQASRISYLAADAHKWMLGPEGTAIFYASAAAREHLEVLESGWMNIDRKGRFIGSDLGFLEDGRRFEAGSLNTNGIYGATASLELLNEIGSAAIAAEVLHLAERLGSGLERLGLQVRTPKPYRSGIVSVMPNGFSPDKLAALGRRLDFTPVALHLLHHYLEKENVICAAREGMLRFSPHFYNSDDEVDAVLSLLAELI